MQARAFPPCLPGPGRNDLFLGSVGKRAPAVRVRAVDGPSAAAAVADLPPAEVTWQIVVGAVAGVTPFVVAGVEFGKRIVSSGSVSYPSLRPCSLFVGCMKYLI
uniref:Predicted protein n=1 Tax=Hordeum vulgare subsp. vulgare TaxID=112509 RepID=F2CWJ4_HORVV|nr:predicted protein [Hordeum vulgare subsp. vulgare]